QGAGASHAAHHLVENEEHAVAIADLAHALEISRHRGDGAQGGAHDRLGDEGDDVLAAELFELALELLRQAFAVGLRRLVSATVAVFISRGYMVRLDQQRGECPALPLPAADCERTERNAVIALTSCNDVPALDFAALDEVLARELERRLHGLRPSAHEEE